MYPMHTILTDRYPSRLLWDGYQYKERRLIMQSRSKIGVLGGDRRQLALCSLFAERGFECALWGLDTESDSEYTNIVKCAHWKCALSEADAVILPLPLTTDGVRLNCSKTEYKKDIYVPRITEIIENTDRNTLLFGGKVPATVKRYATEHNIKLTDYYESEEFQIKNAVPTAEGALAIAISALEITLADAKCAVIGYGRIGRTLALRLNALGCDTTCIARSKKDLAWASCDSTAPLSLNDYSPDAHKFDVIFNTVPHMIFDSAKLASIPKSTIIIDLASEGRGVDSAEAEKLGIKTIKALSLPGKTSPFTAGKIIFESVMDTLREEGKL